MLSPSLESSIFPSASPQKSNEAVAAASILSLESVSFTSSTFGAAMSAGIAVIAPRILFLERGSRMRSEAVTGSFTGAVACGDAAAAAAGAVAVCAHPEARQKHAKNNVTRMRFMESLLNMLERGLERDLRFTPINEMPPQLPRPLR